MMPAWRWAGACSIGTSHLKSNLECQDRASCMQIVGAEREYLSIVVSDGAGSAERAALGASIEVLREWMLVLDQTTVDTYAKREANVLPGPVVCDLVGFLMDKV